MAFEIRQGDCVELMAAMPTGSVESIVCDPPYLLNFMGKDFDSQDGVHADPKQMQEWHQVWATEALRVLKPGGHLLAFGGTRTYHRLACAVEDAGFEIRDSIANISTPRPAPPDLLGEWIEWTERNAHAGLRLVGQGGDSVPGPVLLGTSLERSSADAIIAELASSEARRTDAGSWRSALERAGETSTESSALVTIAGNRPASPDAKSSNGSTAPDDALDWLSASTEHRTKAVEALRIWHGSSPSSRRAATDALCAALTDALKAITCAQSRTFQNYDTTLRTVCVCATTATTTASTAAHLISFTADTLVRQGGDATEASSSGPLLWIYGSGFPPSKSLDVGKAIDRPRSEDREPTQHVAAFLREALKRSALSQREFEERAGLGFNSACNFNQPNRKSFAVPSWERWLSFKSVLGFGDDMDAEVWRLDGRKGQPGKAWGEREVVGSATRGPAGFSAEQVPRPWKENIGKEYDLTAPATPEAERWEGWGTALKPAHEPVVVARKPLSGTVAATVLEHGTGALNIDGTRIEGDVPSKPQPEFGSPTGQVYGFQAGEGRNGEMSAATGRWPSNVVLAHTEECKEQPSDRWNDERLVEWTWVCSPDCAVRLLDEQTGELKSGGDTQFPGRGLFPIETNERRHYAEVGGASRFMKNVDWKHEEAERRAFYCAKASRSERNAGLEGFEETGRTLGHKRCAACGRQKVNVHGSECQCPEPREWVAVEDHSPRANSHPTVKPISLMRWLVRLVTPPGGTICDPFTGSGSTGAACMLEGFDFIGLEREPEYVDIARARIAWWHKHRGDGEAVDILAAGEARDEVEATGQLDMFG